MPQQIANSAQPKPALKRFCRATTHDAVKARVKGGISHALRLAGTTDRYTRPVTRIIAGAAGSLRLEVPKAGTRPTSDRVREAIFSALESWNLVEGARVLDLYAGSGALGLEAASRGAAAVVLVEKHPQAAQVAAKNAKTVLGAFRGAGAPRIETARSSVQSYLELRAPGVRGGNTAAESREQYDVIMLDPPYDLGEEELAANLVSASSLLAPDGVVMVERSSRSPEPSWPEGLTQFREKRYGETVLWWAEHAVEDSLPTSAQ